MTSSGDMPPIAEALHLGGELDESFHKIQRRTASATRTASDLSSNAQFEVNERRLVPANDMKWLRAQAQSQQGVELLELEKLRKWKSQELQSRKVEFRQLPVDTRGQGASKPAYMDFLPYLFINTPPFPQRTFPVR